MLDDKQSAEPGLQSGASADPGDGATEGLALQGISAGETVGALGERSKRIDEPNAGLEEDGFTSMADYLEIKSLIYTVLDVQVMLDSDLAALYGVETKRINEVVRRNADRFPVDFCFRVPKSDARNLRSQIATLHPERELQDSWWRYPPRVFTEQGVAMLSAVLRSRVAVEASVRIMRAFVEMRRFIAGNAAMFEQIRAVELRQLEYQRTTDERFERVFDCMEAHGAGGPPRQKVFLDGQVYDAFELLVSLVRRARREVVLIDGHVDLRTLNVLAKKREGVAVVVYTRDNGRLTEADAASFGAQYGPLEVRRTSAFHDRFLVLDGEEAYHVGASIKDAGKKCFALTRVEDPVSVTAILERAARG